MRDIRKEQSLERKAQGEIFNLFVGSVLTFLILFHAVNMIIVLKLDTAHVNGMESSTYTRALRFYLTLRYGSLKEKLAAFYAEAPLIYPPLLSSLGGVLIGLLGAHPDVATLVNLPFFAVLLVSTYLLGAHLFNREAGLIAAIMLSFFPATFALSRVFFPDFALAATVTLTILLMARQERWSFTRLNVAAWLAFAATALTRQTFFLFMTGPIIIFIAKQPAIEEAWKKKQLLPARTIALNLLLGALIIITLAGPWYANQGKRFLAEYYESPSYHSLSASSSLTDTLDRIGDHGHIFTLQVLTTTAVLSVAGLLYVTLILKKHRILLMSWFLFPYVYFLLVPTDNVPSLYRYLMPALPVAALSLGALISEILARLQKSRLWKGNRMFYATIGFILLIEVPVFFSISYAPGGYTEDPFGEGEQPDYWSYFPRGKTAPFDSGITDSELRNAREIIGEEFLAASEPPTLFLLNPNGIVSNILVGEIEREALLGKYEFKMVPADISGRLVDMHQDIRGFQEAEYALIECYNFDALTASPEGPLLESRKPLNEHILSSLDNYTILLMLPNRFATVEHEQCLWMNRSVLLLKRNLG